jgi:hypothetical protein
MNVLTGTTVSNSMILVDATIGVISGSAVEAIKGVGSWGKSDAITVASGHCVD